MGCCNSLFRLWWGQTCGMKCRALQRSSRSSDCRRCIGKRAQVDLERRYPRHSCGVSFVSSFATGGLCILIRPDLLQRFQLHPDMPSFLAERLLFDFSRRMARLLSAPCMCKRWIGQPSKERVLTPLPTLMLGLKLLLKSMGFD